jgi:hypothetical protein
MVLASAGLTEDDRPMPWYWVRMENAPDVEAKRKRVLSVVKKAKAQLVGNELYWSVRSPYVYGLIGDIDEATAKALVYALDAVDATPLLDTMQAKPAFELGDRIKPRQ